MLLIKIFKLIVHLILIAALLVFLASMMSCSKQTEFNVGRYDMVVDHLSLDTTKIYGRYKQDLGILVPSEAAKIDTAKDLWYINCATRDTLEHLYYLRDNKKIQP